MRDKRIGRRLRFYVEAGIAAFFAVVSCLLLWRADWIEELLGVNPDHGSGLAEWALPLLCGATALLVSEVARREWIRTVTA
jgi:hypothetical protein